MKSVPRPVSDRGPGRRSPARRRPRSARRCDRARPGDGNALERSVGRIRGRTDGRRLHRLASFPRRRRPRQVVRHRHHGPAQAGVVVVEDERREHVGAERLLGIVDRHRRVEHRVEAPWDYLKWKHIHPILRNEEVIAARIDVYAGEEESYFSFITPEAYHEVQKWILYRKESGENISAESWVMRNIWNSSKGRRLGIVKEPKKLQSTGVKRLVETALWTQGLETKIESKQKEA